MYVVFITSGIIQGSLFYISIVVIGSFLLINLALAVIKVKFCETHHILKENIKVEKEKIVYDL